MNIWVRYTSVYACGAQVGIVDSEVVRTLRRLRRDGSDHREQNKISHELSEVDLGHRM